MMALAVLLGLLSVGLLGPAARWLEPATWQSRAPRASIALWQSVGVAGALCAIGAGLAVAGARFGTGFFAAMGDLGHQIAGPHPLAGMGVTEALGLTLALDTSLVLTGGVVLTLARTVRARSRHRRLLDLVGTRTDAARGAVVLDHPRPAAYCLPGLRSRIVVSSGTIRLLDRQQLSAVVAHEHGHAREHHGLVMLPFTSLALFGWIPYARRAPTAVGRLVELAADDHAARHHDPAVLASALVHLATAGAAPRCALAAGGLEAADRVRRLLRAGRTSRGVALEVLALSASVFSAPLVLAALS